MKNNTVKPFHELLEVRPDVWDGTLDQSAYAASLGDVIRDVPAAKEYSDPVLFREMTYETEGMRKVFEGIRIRLQDGKGNGVRQIETSFGGGKTHAMIAMYHKCRDWNARPIVIDGQLLDVKNTLWGEIERQLDGTITKMMGQAAPSGGQIYELLNNRSKPILILIDEIFNYVKRAATVSIGNSDLADQTITFMQNLNGQLGSLPNVCLVMSLSKRDDVLAADTGNITASMQNEYYSNLQKVAGRQRKLVTVSEYNDISHIIRRRLFSTKEDTIQYSARNIIQYCIDQMKKGGSLSGDDIESYTERFSNTYPFTPDVIDVLHKRWGSYPTVQRTRGILRLLSLVVHSLLESKRSWIAPGDVNLSISEISQELLRHTGDNAASVIAADIVGSDALANKEGVEGVRCAQSIFMYSFPSTTRGATYAEVKRAAFTYNTSHSTIGDITGRLLRRCFYLKQTDDNLLWFDVKPNINHMIEQAKMNVSDGTVQDEERKWLDGAIDGGKFPDVHIWPDETHAFNIPDRPVLQLVICKKNDADWCKKVVNGTNKSHRINMNGLIFLLPNDGIMLGDLLRSYLGIRTVQQRLSNTPEYTKATRTLLDTELGRVRDGIGDELLKKYCVVYIPEKGGGVVGIRDYMFNPRLDSRKPLDHLLWERLVSEDHIAMGMAPDIAKQYGNDADGAYDTMIRTPGNVIPASLEVVRRAFETKEPEDTSTRGSSTGGGTTRGGTTYGGSTGGGTTDELKQDKPEEPEVTYERMVYTDVVDASGLDTIRSLLLEPRYLKLTAFDSNAKMRPDGKYDVRVEIRGEVPERIVSFLESAGRGHVETDGGWDE